MKDSDSKNPYIQVETITSYKAIDGRVFEDKARAINHNKEIVDTEIFIRAVSDITDLFKEELNKYDGDDCCEVDPETDFWEQATEDITTSISCDVILESFNDYMALVKMLMEEFKLEKVVKIIKRYDAEIAKMKKVYSQ